MDLRAQYQRDKRDKNELRAMKFLKDWEWQVVLGARIADFFNSKKGTIIEIDGPRHCKACDQFVDHFFKKFCGIVTYRIRTMSGPLFEEEIDRIVFKTLLLEDYKSRVSHERQSYFELLKSNDICREKEKKRKKNQERKEKKRKVETASHENERKQENNFHPTQVPKMIVLRRRGSEEKRIVIPNDVT